MFMKAILHNKEDDLHFLLKCLIEEVGNQHAIRKADDEDDEEDGFFFDDKTRADDKLGDEILDSEGISALAEREALKQTKEKESADERQKLKNKDGDKTKARLVSSFSEDFQDKIKEAIQQAEKKGELTREQKEKISYDIREKQYKEFIARGEPLEIYGWKWSIKEIKAVWKEYTADRKLQFRKNQYRKDRAELESTRNLVNSFDKSNYKKAIEDARKNLLFSKDIPKINLKDPKASMQVVLLRSALDRFDTSLSILMREEQRGMLRAHPKNTKEGKMIGAYQDRVERARGKFQRLYDKYETDVNAISGQDSASREEKEKLYEKYKKDVEATKKFIEDQHKAINEKLPKDKKGAPIWMTQYKLTDEELKKLKDRVAELESKVSVKENKDDKEGTETKYFQSIARRTEKVSPLQVLRVDKDKDAKFLRDFKELLEEKEVKEYLDKLSTMPLEDKTLTAYMKGKYSDAKLQRFLDTDAKSKGIKDYVKGKKIPLGDGKSLKTEAYRRVFNYLDVLKDKVKENPLIVRNVKKLQKLLSSKNQKMFKDLLISEKEKGTRSTNAAYSSLNTSLKNMKQIVGQPTTSDNKLLVEATKIFDNKKYGSKLIRDLLSVVKGYAIDKKPKKSKGKKQKNTRMEKLTEEIKSLRGKLERFKGSTKIEGKELVDYIALKDEMAKKVKKLSNMLTGYVKGSSALEEQRKLKIQQEQAKKLKTQQGRLNKAEVIGDKLGEDAWKFYDVVILQGKFFLRKRENPLSKDDKTYASIEKSVNEIKEIISNERIYSALQRAYSKMTGGSILEQDKETSEARKEVSNALEALEGFVSKRRTQKALLKPIPAFIVRDLIRDENKLSNEVMKFLHRISKRAENKDGSNLAMNDKRLNVENDTLDIKDDKMKVEGVTSEKYYNVFNVPLITGKQFILENLDPKGKSLVGLEDIESYKENPVEFVRLYWDMQLAYMEKKQKAHEEGEEEEESERSDKTADELLNLNNPRNKAKEQLDALFSILDNRQEGKQFFKAIDDFIEEVKKLQSTYFSQSQKAIETSTFDLEEIARDYSKTVIQRMNRLMDEKGDEPKEDPLTDENKKELDELSAELKEIDNKIKTEREKQAEARKENPDYTSPKLEELLAEKKPIKTLKEMKEAGIKARKIFTTKIYRHIKPIPISPQDGERIVMGALEPLVNQKMADSIEGLLESNIPYPELTKPIRDAFLQHFKSSKKEIESLVPTDPKEREQYLKDKKPKTRQEQYKISTAIMEQMKDEFDDLLKAFKTKNKLVDLSKFNITIGSKTDDKGRGFEAILADEVLGKELSKMADFTDIYDKYIKNLQRLEEIHNKNIKKLEDSKKEKTKEQKEYESLAIQTIPKKQGDEEE